MWPLSPFKKYTDNITNSMIGYLKGFNDMNCFKKKIKDVKPYIIKEINNKNSENRVKKLQTGYFYGYTRKIKSNKNPKKIAFVRKLKENN